MSEIETLLPLRAKRMPLLVQVIFGNEGPLCLFVKLWSEVGAEAQPDARVLGTLGYDGQGGDWLNSTNNKGEKGGNRQRLRHIMNLTYIIQKPHHINERLFHRKCQRSHNSTE